MIPRSAGGGKLTLTAHTQASLGRQRALQGRGLQPRVTGRKWLAGPGQAPGGPPGPSPVRAGCPGPSRLSHSCSSHVLERIGALCILWKTWLTTGALGPLPSRDLEQAHLSSAGQGTISTVLGESPPESILASTCLAPGGGPDLTAALDVHIATLISRSMALTAWLPGTVHRSLDLHPSLGAEGPQLSAPPAQSSEPPAFPLASPLPAWGCSPPGAPAPLPNAHPRPAPPSRTVWVSSCPQYSPASPVWFFLFLPRMLSPVHLGMLYRGPPACCSPTTTSEEGQARASCIPA